MQRLSDEMSQTLSRESRCYVSHIHHPEHRIVSILNLNNIVLNIKLNSFPRSNEKTIESRYIYNLESQKIFKHYYEDIYIYFNIMKHVLMQIFSRKVLTASTERIG